MMKTQLMGGKNSGDKGRRKALNIRPFLPWFIVLSALFIGYIYWYAQEHPAPSGKTVHGFHIPTETCEQGATPILVLVPCVIREDGEELVVPCWTVKGICPEKVTEKAE